MDFLKKKFKVQDGSHAVDFTLWKRLYKRVGTHWKVLIIALLFSMFGAVTQPAMAYLMKPLLDDGFLGAQKYFIWFVPVAVISLMFIRGIFNFGSQYLMAWVANKVLYGIRQEMFSSLLFLPDSEFAKGDTGRLLNRFTVDANNVTEYAAEVITIIVRETFVIFALFCMLLWLSWQLTLIILVIFPASILVARYFARRLRSINRKTIDINAELTSVLKESIEGQRVVKMYNGYEHEQQRFHVVSNRLRQYFMRTATAEAIMSPLTQWFISLAVAAVISVALYQGNNGMLTVGAFISFITALGQIFDPVKRLTNVAAKAQKMMMATESVFKLIDAPNESSLGTKMASVNENSVIEFKDVSFKFPGSEINTINQLNLRVPVGQSVAVVGRSGGGKTTLVNMIPRFLDPTEGEISLDGVALNQFDLGSLRSHIALVSQHVFLFDGTLAENVAYGLKHEVSNEKIMAALESANLLQFVQTLPNGLDTRIGENGSWLSGGQRQRLAIARALLKDAPILILDEATSALDNESEKLVQMSLETLMKDRTTFVIAHRLSTIRNADRILVLDDGKIAEEGKHEELLKLGGLYSSLALLAQKSDVAQQSTNIGGNDDDDN